MVSVERRRDGSIRSDTHLGSIDRITPPKTEPMLRVVYLPAVLGPPLFRAGAINVN
jgi:hypothetical protein